MVGLFGSGNEARHNLEAICCVRKVEHVEVFSPRHEHQETFAREMSELLRVEVQPVFLKPTDP